MIKTKESKISAFHNYLINSMLSPGLLTGNPHTGNAFYLLFDVIEPGDKMPLVYATIYSSKKELMAKIRNNELIENPGRCTIHFDQGYFAVSGPDERVILVAKTQEFTNGYMTTISARLYDEKGILRVEPLGESIHVRGQESSVLSSPFFKHL